MAKQTIIPFGPQHPVLPEPIHLDLVLEDEKVVQAIPSIGFIHRGLEKLVDKKDFRNAVFTAATQSGRSVRILHQLTQPGDHPVNIYHPEGEYLKGLVLYVE